MKRTTLTCLLTLTFAYAGCGGRAVGNTGSLSSTNSVAGSNTSSTGDAGPAVAVTAAELGKEYQQDPGAFDAKYKGKTLAITGNAILAGKSGDHFAIMLLAVENEATAKSVSIECGVANSEQANQLGKAVDARLEQVKNAGGNGTGVEYPVVTIKGTYDHSPGGGDHGETMSIIWLKPCELATTANGQQ